MEHITNKYVIFGTNFLFLDHLHSVEKDSYSEYESLITEYECCRGNADGNVHKWTEQNGNCSPYKNHGIIRFVNHYPKYIYPVKDVQNQHFSKHLLMLKISHKNSLKFTYLCNPKTNLFVPFNRLPLSLFCFPNSALLKLLDILVS